MLERYSRPQMAFIFSDQNKFNIWLQIELAACEAMVNLGIVPYEAFQRIKSKANYDIKRIAEIEATTKHDVIAFLTSVGEFIGEDSRYLHIGMTSSDVLDTTLAVQMVQAADLILKDLEALREAIRRKAIHYKLTPMIGRTHGIHAEPITFGLKMAVWFDETNRNIQRLQDARDNIAFGKLSGAVGTFAHLPMQVEEFVMAKMGLKPDPASTQIVQRDRHAHFLTTLAIIGCSLEKFAIEIRNLQRTDILEVEEGFSKGQKGSSAMPHKRNPIGCEQISGSARILRANALAALENVALWHERDISHSSVERVIIPDSCILLDYSLARFTSILDNLFVYPERMMENLNATKGLIFSQRVLLALADKGLPREKAYEIVQRNAMKSWAEKGEFKRNLLDDKELITYLTPEEIEECFSLDLHLKNIDAIYKRAGIL